MHGNILKISGMLQELILFSIQVQRMVRLQMVAMTRLFAAA